MTKTLTIAALLSAVAATSFAATPASAPMGAASAPMGAASSPMKKHHGKKHDKMDKMAPAASATK